jgi:hypothetical protein
MALRSESARDASVVAARTVPSCDGSRTICRIVSIGVRASTGCRYFAAHSRNPRKVTAAKLRLSAGRAGRSRSVPVRTPPMTSRRMISFFSSSGTGSSST